MITVRIFERRRSTVISGGICHTNPRILATQDSLSILLITINCLFLIMTAPFNISLIIQSIIKFFFSKPLLMKFLSQLNQYLRLLQNSYHALSFVFYCVAGNKFRECAWSMYKIIYCKLFQFIFGHQPKDSSIILRCLERKNVINYKSTASTSANDINKQMPTDIIKE
jgi:hypothetical protein